MRALYALYTSTAFAVSTANKTILAARGGAAFGMDLKRWGVSFDGVTASAVPILVELCAWTGAGAGTSGVAVTPLQTGGRTIAPGLGASGSNYTAEPTALNVIKAELVTPNGGLFEQEFGWDSMPDSDVLSGFAIRLSAGAAVNARAFMEWMRI